VSDLGSWTRPGKGSTRKSKSSEDVTMERREKLRQDLRLAEAHFHIGEAKGFIGRLSSTIAGLGVRSAQKSCVCEFVQGIVEGRIFQLVVITAILSNAIFIGVSSDLMMRVALSEFDQRTGGSAVMVAPSWVEVADVFFTFIFAVELVLRVIAVDGRLLTGPDWKWNLFDFVLVLSSLLDLAMSSISTNVKHMRTLRVFRIFRSFRIFNLLRGAASLFHKLRLMLLAILISAVPFFWAVVILLMFVFIFSVMFVHGIADYISEAPALDPNIDVLRTFFGSMPMALLTLIMSVLGGVSWWEVIQPLLFVSSIYGLLFVTFVLVTVLAAMNIITGVFVNDSLEAASMDKDIMIQMDMEDNRNLLLKLRSIFHTIDEDGWGTVSAEQLEKHIKSDEVKLILTQLGLDVVDVTKFFNVLDSDGSSTLEIEEFVMGCMRFKSKGKTVDIEAAVNETRQIMRKTYDQQQAVVDAVCRLEEFVSAFCGRANNRINFSNYRGETDLFPHAL